MLQEAEAGAKGADPARRHGVSEAMIDNWQASLGGLAVSEPRRLRAAESVKAKLERLLAESVLDNAILKDLLGKV